VKALPGNPYDGHTLETVIPDMEALVGNTIARILAEQRLPRPQCTTPLQVQGLPLRQKRGVTPQIKRELRRRSAVEPVIQPADQAAEVVADAARTRCCIAAPATREVAAHAMLSFEMADDGLDGGPATEFTLDLCVTPRFWPERKTLNL